MSAKNDARIRRAKKARTAMRKKEVVRLCVHRSPRHIYAQIINAEGNQVIAAASTLDKDLRTSGGGNISAAGEVGKLIAERAKEKGIESVAFDRSGYKYHGRVKALADAARAGGLQF